MATRVMILAGGTGGHIFPALAVARELRERGCEIRWMGTESGLEARLVPAAGIAIEWLAVAGFRGKGLLGKLIAPFKLARACWQAAHILRRNKPDVVLGMGGFVAGPGGLMAKVLGIPLVIHEQNRIPGTTNRLLIKWAKVALEAFPNSFTGARSARWVGNPLRREMLETWSEEKPGVGSKLNVLVLGGSQGAKILNEQVPQALVQAGIPCEVLHQTGITMQVETETLYQRLPIEANVVSFIEDMAGAYRWADLAICRAGAMTISELSAAALPAILIPYPFAIDDHQTANALYLVHAGAAILMPQSELTAERLADEIKTLVLDPERLPTLSRSAHALAKPEAARLVAEVCLCEAGL